MAWALVSPPMTLLWSELLPPQVEATSPLELLQPAPATLVVMAPSLDGEGLAVRQKQFILHALYHCFILNQLCYIFVVRFLFLAFQSAGSWPNAHHCWQWVYHQVGKQLQQRPHDLCLQWQPGILQCKNIKYLNWISYYTVALAPYMSMMHCFLLGWLWWPYECGKHHLWSDLMGSVWMWNQLPFCVCQGWSSVFLDLQHHQQWSTGMLNDANGVSAFWNKTHTNITSWTLLMVHRHTPFLCHQNRVRPIGSVFRPLCDVGNKTLMVWWKYTSSQSQTGKGFVCTVRICVLTNWSKGD